MVDLNPLHYLTNAFNLGTGKPAAYAPKVKTSPTPAPTVVPQGTGLVTYDNNGNPVKSTTASPSGGRGVFDLVGNIRDAFVSSRTGGKYQNADDFLKAVNARMKAGGGGSSGGGSGGGSYGGGGGVPGASLALQLATNPYDRALAQLGLDYKNNRGQAITQGKRQDADLAELFSRLGNYTTGVMNTGRRDFVGTGKSLARNYDALGQNIAGTYKTGVGNTNAELQRLGIDAVTPAALAGLGKDALYLGNQTKIDKSNAIGNNNANADVFKSLMREMIGSAAVEGTSQRGHAKQATADALNALLQNYAKGKNDLSGKRADALLSARLQNQRLAAAASERAASRRAAAAGAAAKAAAERKPSGYADALMMLQNAAGGPGSQKYLDYKTELDTLLNADWSGPRDPKDANPYLHLQNYWGGSTGNRGRTTYGQQGIDALLAALAAAQKRY